MTTTTDSITTNKSNVIFVTTDNSNNNLRSTTHTLRYKKIRNVKTPKRAHSTDGGFDLYVPEDLTLDTMSKMFDMTNHTLSVEFFNQDEELKTIKSFFLKPGDSILIPIGLKFNIPHGYALIAMNKSGIATKRGLLVGACVIDESYTGEVFINLHNVSDRIQKISAGEKIIQLLMLPVNYCVLEEFEGDNEEDFLKKTTRGDGGFGSSGLN